MSQVRIALIDRRLKSMNPLKRVDDAMLGIKQDYFREMVDVVIANTPVETGNYADSHSLSESRSGGMARTNSHGLPKGQDAGGYQESARERLYAAIQSIGPLTKNAIFRNSAVYASRVEYEYGYAPYTKAREAAESILAGLMQEYRL